MEKTFLKYAKIRYDIVNVEDAQLLDYCCTKIKIGAYSHYARTGAILLLVEEK